MLEFSEKRIKVLQVLGSLNMGGAESRMMDVYRMMDRGSIHFDFLIFQKDEQFFEKEVQELGGEIIKLKMPGPGSILRHIRQLRQVMRTGGYDAVHAHTSYHCGLVMYAAWREKIPVRISHARTTSTKRQGIAREIMVALGRALIKLFATDRLAISKDAGSYLFSGKEYTVLPNAIDIERYQVNGERDRALFREELGIPDGAFAVGQIGRFDPMKNHAFSLHWFRQYREQHPDSYLILVGDGPLRKGVQLQTEDLGVQNYVRFTGIRGDVPDLIHAFDVLLFPSTYEGLGGVVLESQAAGIPIVISDTLPTETDMGLGLVQRCSLSAELSVWNQAIDAARDRRHFEKTELLRAFDTKGFSLTYEISALTGIYRKGRA